MNPLLLSLVCIFIGKISLLSGHQLISLKRPSLSKPLVPLQAPKSRYTAKPGDVVVHFDQNHEIQQLQYVLRDGRLASLYKRRSDLIGNRAPIQVSSNQHGDINANLAIGDSENTIEIIDSNSQEVSRLVGSDHITLELPDSSTKGTIIETFSSGQEGQGLQLDQLIDNKMDILATVAVNGPNQLSQGPKMRISGIILDKLKNKVRQKLRELPRLIENKLRAKSSVGQVFLDQAGRKVVIVDDESSGSGELPSGEIPTLPQPIRLRQPIFSSAIPAPTKTETLSVSTVDSAPSIASTTSSLAPASPPVLMQTMQQSTTNSHLQQSQTQMQTLSKPPQQEFSVINTN